MYAGNTDPRTYTLTKSKTTLRPAFRPYCIHRRREVNINSQMSTWVYEYTSYESAGLCEGEAVNKSLVSLCDWCFTKLEEPARRGCGRHSLEFCLIFGRRPLSSVRRDKTRCSSTGQPGEFFQIVYSRTQSRSPAKATVGREGATAPARARLPSAFSCLCRRSMPPAADTCLNRGQTQREEVVALRRRFAARQTRTSVRKRRKTNWKTQIHPFLPGCSS